MIRDRLRRITIWLFNHVPFRRLAPHVLGRTAGSTPNRVGASEREE